MSSSNIIQIRQEYEQKVKEIKDLMKNPSMDIENFSNDTSFQDKNLTFAASGCINSNNSTCIEKYPIKGYPYKRGVKLSFG
ncbi:DUF228 domain-containing protein, partial [Borrelia hispanica]|uniref:DUF228 domain-containing protein n=1 Tax=Borrelia hispanica TaxID=40835 RepID=UPI000463DAC8